MNAAERRRALVFPREHGAWAILLVPLVTGASLGLLAGGRAWLLAPLSIAVLALFLLRLFNFLIQLRAADRARH